MSDKPIELQILEQLDSIYSKENLAKNAFFREMTEQDPDHWVSLKKFSVIKQFKGLVQGNVDLLIQAAEQSNGRFEVNEDKTKLRKVPGAQDEVTETDKENEEASKPDEKVLDYWRQQNLRSIYAKGFPESLDESGYTALSDFFKEQGRVLTLKMRKDDDKKFKGSVFVEFDSPDTVKQVLEKKLEYKGQPLTMMLKQDYIDMKAKEKFQGVDFQHSNDKKRRNNFMIQYEGAGDMGFRDIRELISKKTPVGTVEKLSEPGTGVLELKEMTPDAFLELLGPEHKLEGMTFKLADMEAREVMKKSFQQKRGFKGGRGGGRGGRGGRGGGRGRPQKKQRTD
ncbi:hypothetical protein RO3G_16990 [Lichtheimia corymbifera JMRC:FSU:9682]|uniref:Uncharacterized protein n=1 Tax=Lichtheimia corymbifera JMRC:FSU:9682 TaxID=1263082 RepID=A0A068RFF3_9FUNG|nr:hypothetical protein RO3G_16990 [Lichtheimia corymbifera JMRC:FSU:9682]